MNNINCNIIRDILPLYADEVVSDDTKTLVEGHLAECEACTQQLHTIRSPIVLPIQEDEVKTIRTFKRRWGWKKVLQGVLATLLTFAVGFGIFMFLYGYGLPVKAEDLIIRTGLQCKRAGDDTETCPTGEHLWIIDIDTHIGDYRDTCKFQYEVINGKEVCTGVTLYARRTPFIMPWDYAGYIRAGYDWPEDLPTDEGYDFTVTIVCADQTLTYSLREEGILEPAAEHSPEFCTVKSHELWMQSQEQPE